MEIARVVEVLHDRGATMSPRWLLGSGFVIKPHIIITAAHNLGDNPDQCGEHGTVVRTLDGTEHTATLLARSDQVDIALLVVAGINAQPARIGRVDSEHIEVLRNVIAVGFPNYKYSQERPTPLKRQPAQPFGFIPTSEGISGGDLTLKVEAGEPATSQGENNSPWEGLSGAGVFVEECLLAIVIEHHPSEGLGSLRLMPISRILDLPGSDGLTLRAILGFDTLEQLDLINGDQEAHNVDDLVLTAIIKDLREVIELGEQGLLTPAEASALKLTAYKEAKGWK